MTQRRVLAGSGSAYQEVFIDEQAGGSSFTGLPIKQAGVLVGNAQILNFQAGATVAINGGDPTQIDVTITLNTAYLGGNTITIAGGNAVTVNYTALGTTSANALLLQNTTAAALGAQQNSPQVQLLGNQWNTGTGTSRAVGWGIRVAPVQAASQRHSLVFTPSDAGATTSTGIFFTSSVSSITAANIQSITGVALYTAIYDGLGATATNTAAGGFTAANFTAAANGAQQYSPAFKVSSYGWGTTAGLSEFTQWWIFNRPVQGLVANNDLVFYQEADGIGVNQLAMFFRYNQALGMEIHGGTSSCMAIIGEDANDASGLGVVLDSTTALVTQGARVVSFRNAGTEFLNIWDDGTDAQINGPRTGNININQRITMATGVIVGSQIALASNQVNINPGTNFATTQYRFTQTVLWAENNTKTFGDGTHIWLESWVRYYVTVLGGVLSSTGVNSTITPTRSMHHVSGVGSIQTITVPAMQDGSTFVGSIDLIPDAIFTWVATGNIALAGTAVVGKTLRMTFDGTLWCPSYVA